METAKRTASFLLCLVASSFLIFESGLFYSSFYPSNYALFIGFLVAVLSESFLILFVATTKGGGRGSFYGLKLLAILLFLNSTFSASLFVILPRINVYKQAVANEKIEAIRGGLLEAGKKQLEFFAEKNQVRNTARIGRDLQKNAEQQIETVKAISENDKLILILQVVVLLLARVLIQTANLFSVSYYSSSRQPIKQRRRPRKVKEKEPPSDQYPVNPFNPPALEEEIQEDRGPQEYIFKG